MPGIFHLNIEIFLKNSSSLFPFWWKNILIQFISNLDFKQPKKRFPSKPFQKAKHLQIVHSCKVNRNNSFPRYLFFISRCKVENLGKSTKRPFFHYFLELWLIRRIRNSHWERILVATLSAAESGEAADLNLGEKANNCQSLMTMYSGSM